MGAPLVQAPIAITTGAYTNVTAKTWARGVRIEEDGSVAPGGIRVKWPNGNIVTYTPAQQPVIIGIQELNGTGSFVGKPAASLNTFNDTATIYCAVESVAATGSLRVTEIP